MTSLRFDFGDFERAAARMNAAADQIPFALAQSLNVAVEIARRELIDTSWAQHVTVRNPRFLAAALTARGNRATKRNLRVAIVDKLGRGSLLQHAEGGTKRAKTSNLAIPSRALAARRTGKGVPKGLRPTFLPNSFKRGDQIFQRTGTGKDRGLKLMYTLRPSAPIKADVPFEADFRRVMARQVALAFGPRLAAAMAGRRK